MAVDYTLDSFQRLNISDAPQKQLINIFVQSWRSRGVDLDISILTKRYEMRLDLFSFDKYGTPNYVDMLMFVNDILNPFSVREGDFILYPTKGDLSQMNYQDSEILRDDRQRLINQLKQRGQDPARQNYLQNRGVDQLPGTVVPEGAPKIVVDNNRIKLAPNLFTNPNNNIDQVNLSRSLQPALGGRDPIPKGTLGGFGGQLNERDVSSQMNQGGVSNNTGQNRQVIVRNNRPVIATDGETDEIQTERVLVRRFIRNANDDSTEETNNE